MAMSRAPPGHNHGQMQQGAALSGKMMKVQNEGVRDAIYNQPAPDVTDQLSGITGYHVPDDRSNQEASRPLTDINRANAQSTVINARQGLQTFGNFSTADPYDKVVQGMRSVINKDGVIPGIGKVQIRDDSPFWDYVARKKALELQEQFQSFIYNQIDLSSPESREYWESKFPEFTKQLREGLYKNRLIKAKLEDIGLYGARNEKDMWLLYLREKGIGPHEKGIDTVPSQEPGIYQGLGRSIQRPMGSSEYSDTGTGTLSNWGSYLRTLVFTSGYMALNPGKDSGLDVLSGPPNPPSQNPLF